MSYQDIHASEVADFLTTEGLIVIDQRDEHTRSKGQLPSAQPASEAVISKLMMQRRKNPPVLVYCYHGNQSRELCSFLAQFGLSRVYNLEGGWQAWEGWQQQAAAPSNDDDPLQAWLLANGFDADDLNSRVEMGMSPLMLAALKGEKELVERMLAMGANPNHVNDDNHHALWFACVNGDTGLVATLIANGGNVDNRNVNDVTCAIYAASTGKLEVLKLLVEAGADLSVRTNGGYDALESASTLPVLRYLRPLVKQAG